MKVQAIFIAVFMLTVGTSCSKTDTTDTTISTDGTTTNNFSKLYAKMYNVNSIDTSGSTSVIIKTNNVPNHKSPFFGSGHAKYEECNGDNPNFSTSINLMGTISNPTLISRATTFTIPRYPKVASVHASTSGDSNRFMGITQGKFDGCVVFTFTDNDTNAWAFSGFPNAVNKKRQIKTHFPVCSGSNSPIFQINCDQCL